MGDGKAKNVIEYLDYLVEKGKATNGAISPLKIAFRKVLQTIDSDAWENVEVKSIEVEDYMARFANLTMGKYSTHSLTVYKSRVNKVIQWYLHFLETPGWTPDVGRRERTTKKQPKSVSLSGTSSRNGAQEIMAPPQSMPSIINAANRILYPFPLTDGQLVHISLPVKLTKIDARRIGAFIESIATEDIKVEEK